MNELIYIFGIPALVILIAIVIGKFGSPSKKVIDNISNAKTIVALLIEVLRIDDEKKREANFILDLAQTAVDYVSALSIKDEDKYNVTMQTIDELLAKFQITPSSSEKRLIEIIVKESLDYLDKNPVN